MDKSTAVATLKSELAICSDPDARDVRDILRLGAGDLGLPDDAMLSDPDFLSPGRREAYMSLRETIEHHSEGEEFFPARSGEWEHVLLTLIVERAWEMIRKMATDLRSDPDLVKARDWSR